MSDILDTYYCFEGNYPQKASEPDGPGLILFDPALMGSTWFLFHHLFHVPINKGDSRRTG